MGRKRKGGKGVIIGVDPSWSEDYAPAREKNYVERAKGGGLRKIDWKNSSHSSSWKREKEHEEGN